MQVSVTADFLLSLTPTRVEGQVKNLSFLPHLRSLHIYASAFIHILQILYLPLPLAPAPLPSSTSSLLLCNNEFFIIHRYDISLPEKKGLVFLSNAKAWKQCQAWFSINCNQSLQQNLSQMKCKVWKPCIDQCRPALTGQSFNKLWFSIWRFFEQSAFVNNHLLCHWPIIHNSISKICPKLQVIIYTFPRSMSCLMSKNCAKWKYFNSNLCGMR